MPLLRRLLGSLCVLRFGFPVDLPVAGLRVELPRDDLAVESAWGPEGGFDWLLAEGQRRYRVDVVGRTGSDCPLAGSDVRRIGTSDWVVSGTTACRLVGEARLRVERLAEPLPDEDALFTSLGLSFERRQTTSAPLPPADPPLSRALTLPVTGLSLTLPDDALWRVAPSGDRDHDGLVRLVPALPEVQVVVRRHQKSELPSCDAMRRRLLAGGWTPLDSTTNISTIEIFSAVAKNRFANFDSIAWCAERASELLDVRVATLPNTPPSAFASLWSALSLATAPQERPPLPSVLARRDAAEVFELSVLGRVGAIFEASPDFKLVAGSEPESAVTPVVAVGARVAWALRDGLALTVRGSLGHDRSLSWRASAEVGASLIVARDLALVLSLGWHESRDHLLSNRALGLSVELRRGWFAHQGMRWSLFVSGINLASELPRVLAAPLEIAWQGALTSEIELGLSLRTAPAEVREMGQAVELVFNLGWGRLWR